MNIIETYDLTKEFNGLKAVNRVSFAVKKGEIFGFLGPNGAGKTTTINMLTTLLLPTSGTAKVNDHDILDAPTEVRRSIGIVPQEIVLENDLSARENLQFHADLYNVSKKDASERIPELLRLVGLEKRIDDKVATYSGGMKRRLEIVKAFLHSPAIIFMDEPTQGLDPQTRRVIWDHIKYLNEEEGITIFLTTHYMEEADYLCNRVAIIDHGKILDLDAPENLKDKIGEGDIIDLRVDKVDAFMKEVMEYSPQVLKEGTVRLRTPRGEAALPGILKLSERLGLTISSIALREPTLEDVFIHYTGREIREGKGEGVAKAFIKKMVKG
jgi:ABC-2 type transport system ATP-binding protein